MTNPTITIDNVVSLYRATIAHDAQWLADFNACSADDQLTIACEEFEFNPDAKADPVKTMRETFRDSFMKPECYRGRDIQEAILEAGLDCEDDGIYCRLSASGYLDCTDWHGPFDTVAEAAQCLIDTYGEEA